MNFPGKDPCYLEECTGTNIICTRRIHCNGGLSRGNVVQIRSIIELASDNRITVLPVNCFFVSFFSRSVLGEGLGFVRDKSPA